MTERRAAPAALASACDQKGNNGLPSEDYRLLKSLDAIINVPNSGF